jgi:hypothetical protein
MFGMIILFLVGGSFIFSVFFTPLLNTFNHILFTL